MAWLPPPRGKFLDAAARKAAEMQRSTFLHMLGLRMGDVLHPATRERIAAVKTQIGYTADELFAAHEPSLPSCHRAPTHLQMVALALASQRVLREEARRRNDVVLADVMKVRATVANALGVVAPDDGTPPYEIGGMWLPNKLAFFFTGAMFLPARRSTILERMMLNFEVDLGEGFEIEALEPSPSRRMTRCLYASFLEVESERDDASLAAADARDLMPVFQAMHGATFCGVPGFAFEPDDSGHGGCFRFNTSSA